MKENPEKKDRLKNALEIKKAPQPITIHFHNPDQNVLDQVMSTVGMQGRK
jgi:hypothetical protein